MIGLQSYLCQVAYLVIAITSIPLSLAIRVDWNTNQGPIVPPTTTVRPEPKRPYRDPAPVWESQAGDIPNPNQYKYILPPPRPRFDENGVPQPVDNRQQYQPIISTPTASSSTPVSTTLTVTTSSTSASTSNQANNYNVPNTVPSLAANYIPNYGKQYVPVLPAYPKSQYWSATQYTDKYDKLNGKYNPKLKKFKAFEQKYKFVPFYELHPSKQQFIYFKPQQHVQQLKQWNLNTNHI